MYKFVVMLLLVTSFVACDSGKDAKSSKPAITVNTPPLSPEKIEQGAKLIAKYQGSGISAHESERIYRQYCVTCHGAKGNLKLSGAKDLTISTIPQKEVVAQVYFGKGLMTSFKGQLKDEEIVAVSNYIMGFRK